MATPRPLVLLALLAPLTAMAAAGWEVRYDGPDEMVLVERPNGAGRNTQRAAVHRKELRSGRLASALEPILANALEPCATEDSGEVVVKPAVMIDRIGQSATRMSGLGIYLNLPDADRVEYGNFYIAPFFSFSVSFSPSGRPVEVGEVYSFNRLAVDPRVPTTQDKFLETSPAELMPTVLNFVDARLRATLHEAFPNRCPAPVIAGAEPRQ
ncbi:MAG TPA: hypothetical protein VN598_15985 [Usitatibacter sp.]|nr:hypothetical protein [Usitatibacter sp.]